MVYTTGSLTIDSLSDINTEKASHVARIGNKQMRTKFCFNHVQKETT
jgi:hypothetical protein